MISTLIYELRQRGVQVGLQELISLAQALALDLHESSLDQFYYISRSILIHDESKLDDFDQVFGFLYKDVPYHSKAVLENLLEWLQNPRDRPQLSDEEKSRIGAIDLEELRKIFEERLKEQKERHEGGGYWIGTGGTSPFGTNGYHPSGMSLNAGQSQKSSGGKSSIRIADARRFRSYRDDLVLDVRQIEVGLRKLRTFGFEGRIEELDLNGTIDATARNFGDLEIKFRKPRKPNTRVILMMDIGGSMDPYAFLMSQLFSAAKRATHWKELRTYYFHNCIYGKVFRTEGLKDPVQLRDLFHECDAKYKIILVGDASMAHYELLGDSYSPILEDRKSAVEWLIAIRNHFPKSIWLNPDGLPQWPGTTVDVIRQVFPMYPLTIQGLTEGLQTLRS